MTQAIRTHILTLCLTLLPAGIVFSQTSTSQAAPATTVSAAEVANVYVGTSNGMLLYHAASNGKLTPVLNSYFKLTIDAQMLRSPWTL